MKHLKSIVAVTCTLAMTATIMTGCGKTETKADESGMTQEVVAIKEKKPQKVVSLAPNITEIVYSVGAGDMLVGRTDYCDYPAEASQVESVGTYSAPNVEMIVEKAPDLVISSDNLDENIETQLKNYGIEIYVSHSNNVDEIEREIQVIGYMLDHEEEAEDVVISMQEKSSQIQEMGKDIQTKKKVFADLGSYYTAGTGSFLDAVLKDCYMENIAADTGEQWPQLSVELIAEGNPDVYLSFYTPEEQLKNETALANLNCMKNGGLYVLDKNLGDMLQRQGPRIMDAELELMKMVYNK